MKIYLPFDAENPKTRLSTILEDDERHMLSLCMLRDVYQAISDSSHTPVVLTTSELDEDTQQSVSDEPLTDAVNNVIQSDQPVGVVMADLPLIEPDDIETITQLGGDVVLAPGRGGGTNALISRDSSFHVDFHGASYLDHIEIARSRALKLEVVDSYRFYIDIDTPDDLIDLLIHADGEAKTYLESLFTLIKDDEPRLERRDS